MDLIELLAPARNADTGIAAIDCGADAVYIAGPEFGARQAAGNSIEEIRRLCDYAKRFGVRIFITLNTILFDDELEAAAVFMQQVQDAGADALIVQDTAIVRLAKEKGITIPLHASTQCAIRTPEQALFYQSLGFSRLILERQLSLKEIKSIAESVSCEIECFVHGALCVCYSGQCYLSEHISGRSANRGSCIQACRSRYDLIDSNAQVLVKNKALLSLKDLNLKKHLAELAEAGVSSFKIEGRLKNISYVKNIVREYSLAIDELIAAKPGKWERASCGKVVKGFTPDPDKTFNRGYTDLYLSGKRGQWAAMDSPKGMGEYLGTIASVRYVDRDNAELLIRNPQGKELRLANGDGFSILSGDTIIGFRGDLCRGNVIRCKQLKDLKKGSRIWRNLSADFEKVLQNQVCERLITVELSLSVKKDSQKFIISVEALSEDGRRVSQSFECGESAGNPQRMIESFRKQLEKKSGHYQFIVKTLDCGGELPFLPVSEINAIRRSLAELLDKETCLKKALLQGRAGKTSFQSADYKQNISNKIAESIYKDCGAEIVSGAFELEHQQDAELMRSKYCLRYELGICPKHHHCKDSGALFLLNNGRKLKLAFDCKACEMILFNELKSQS